MFLTVALANPALKRRGKRRRERNFVSCLPLLPPPKKKLCHAPCQKKKGETGVCVQKMMNLDRQRRGRSHGQRAHDVTFSSHTHTRSVPTKKYPIRHFTREPKKTLQESAGPTRPFDEPLLVPPPFSFPFLPKVLFPNGGKKNFSSSLFPPSSIIRFGGEEEEEGKKFFFLPLFVGVGNRGKGRKGNFRPPPPPAEA